MMTSLGAIQCGDKFCANRKVGTGGVAEFTESAVKLLVKIWLGLPQHWVGQKLAQ